MPPDFISELCDEKHKNIWVAIKALQDDYKEVERRIGFFNVTGIGILVSIVTGLILNHFKG